MQTRSLSSDWQARYLLLAVVLFAAACGGHTSRPGEPGRTVRARPAAPSPRTATRPDSAPPTLPSGPTPRWREFRGEGFTLRYPEEATLAPVPAGPDGVAVTAIRGPTVAVRSPHEHIGTKTGPAYEMTIADNPNPGSASVDAWVDSIRHANNAQIREDADRFTELAAPAIIRVGHERALRLEPFCGDCQAEEIYLTNPRRRVLISIVYDFSIPGSRDAQRRLYEAILSTFRWAP